MVASHSAPQSTPVAAAALRSGRIGEIMAMPLKCIELLMVVERSCTRTLDAKKIPL